MLHCQHYTPAGICSLVDHLDATLAACKELLELESTTANAHQLMRLELTAIAHVLQARHDMREGAFEDSTIARQVALFVAVTDCFEVGTPSAGKVESEANQLVGRCIPVATLMALAAAMRDVLGICYRLNDAADEGESQRAPSSVPETLIWATAPEGAALEEQLARRVRANGRHWLIRATPLPGL